MTNLVFFLVLLSVGYLISSLLSENKKLKYYTFSGIEYVIIGFLLSPALSEILKSIIKYDFSSPINNSLLEQINPAIILSVGIIGFTYGLRLKIPVLFKLNSEIWRIAFFNLFATFISIGGLVFVFLFLYLKYDIVISIQYSLIASVILHPASFIILKKFYTQAPSHSSFFENCKQINLLSLYFSIFSFGIILAATNANSNILELTPTEWAVLSIALTSLLGFLFFIFMGRETDENKIFVAIIGFVFFTTGIAYILNFSPLFMTFLLGIIIGNLSKITYNIISTIEQYFRPLSIMICVYAGLIWMNADWISMLWIILILPIRYYSKLISGNLANATAFDKDILKPGIGKSFVSIDILALSMLIEFKTINSISTSPFIINLVLIFFVVYNLISLRITKNYFIDIGEIKGQKI